MTDKKYPSKLLENAIIQFSRFPGIGEKTALRLILYMLKWKKNDAIEFADSIKNLIENIQHCKICKNISDNDICSICSNENRDHTTICIVENINNVMSIENTGQYNGVYHVLGGIISPIDGIGPADLEIESLEKRIKESSQVLEVIFALSTTMEGDTTNFYLYKKLQPYNIRISSLARGIATGDEIEYIDEITLGRSIVNRVDYEGFIKK